MILSHVTNLSLVDVITKIVNCVPLHWLFFFAAHQTNRGTNSREDEADKNAHCSEGKV